MALAFDIGKEMGGLNHEANLYDKIRSFERL